MTSHRIRRSVASLAASLVLCGIFSAGAGASPPPVRVIGEMPFGSHEDNVPQLVVDEPLHLGFFQTHADGMDRIAIYDLKRMRRAGMVRVDTHLPAGVSLDDRLTLDDAHHRVFLLQTGATIPCGGASIWIVDVVRRSVSSKPVPCYQNLGFQVRGLSYYAPENKLYMIGETSVEVAYSQLTGLYNYRESTIIRQVNASTFAVDWDIDASQQCETNTNLGAGPVVGRAPGGVVSYCYVASQGRAVWIPIVSSKPVLGSNGNPIVEVSPTIGRATRPLVDQASGRLLIQEDKAPFGPAVYVYDPPNERFYGVIPSGVSLSQGGTYYDYFRGFDATTGRLYILNRLGLVMADVRHNPLPGGVSYPVLTRGAHDIFNGVIGADGGLHRLFVPYPQKGAFTVVADGVPHTPDPAPVDPDAGTANIPETPGKTDRTFGSAATAYGVHLLLTGGAPRVVDNADILCTSQTSVNDRDQYGRCPLDQMVTPGNREYFVSQTGFDAGLDSGTAAFASTLRSPASDSATDSDLRAAGRCEADHLPDPASGTVMNACPNGKGQPLDAFSNGSRGADGKGFPVKGAQCVDFGSGATTDHGDQNALGASTASCDGAKHTAAASARAAAVELAPSDGVVVTVARSYSTITTALTAKGVVTTARAVASGIHIASGGSEFVIGSIENVATTRARGVSGTTGTTYEVTFHSVHGLGIDCAQCSAATVADAINQALGASVRARTPAPYRLASPHGFQGVVAKDPALQQSDSAVNDDDTVTADGLDLIVYNDSSPTNPNGSAGRSRIVIGFAGVEAESRYGIFVLPEPTDGETNSGPVVLGKTFVPPPAFTGTRAPTQPPVVTANPARVVADVFGLARTRPREFALLFVLFSLLATPVYLGLRRRAFVGSLEKR